MPIRLHASRVTTAPPNNKMKQTIAKRSLQTISAFAGLASGVLWHLSANAQRSALELSAIRKVDPAAVQALNELAAIFNVYAAQSAAVVGFGIFFLLAFDD